MIRKIGFGLLLLVVTPFGMARAENEDCKIFCSPALKLEPTFTTSNLFGGAAIAHLNGDEIDAVSNETRETAFEIILALGIPTAIPRVGVTLEASWKPFGRTDTNPFTGKTAEELGEEDIRDNAVEVEFELNFRFSSRSRRPDGWRCTSTSSIS